MSRFKTNCEKKFPNNWIINDLGNGLFQFRDNLLVKGEGFLVVVQEEFNKFEVEINFEDFAKKLSMQAATTISEIDNPLKKILDLNSHITAVTHKHYVQTNLNPETNKFERWDFKLIFKKLEDYNNADSFSDVLISFILYLFSYSYESEEEGLAKSQISTKYERSHVNRSLCLAYYGYSCKACNINLKVKYGDIARDFINVHHLNPISTSGVIAPDPIMDFIPLCPNCHSIAHLKTPPLTVEEIKDILLNNEEDNTQ
jgi:hypothetical protein